MVVGRYYVYHDNHGETNDQLPSKLCALTTAAHPYLILQLPPIQNQWY